MNSSQSEYLSVFRSIFHSNFESRPFRMIFIKSAWKVYGEMNKRPISPDQFQAVLAPLYETLFNGFDATVNEQMAEVYELFDSMDESALFLTDTFYIVLNQYIRSFYGSLDGWERIISFTVAIQQFLMQVTNRNGDESFFVFEDVLINALEELRLAHESIPVLNTYRGIPIQYRAKIIHTDPQSVILKAHPIQETAALLQHGIYLLRNERFSHDVFADVNDVTIDGERFLRLSRFDKLETSLFHRQNIRVQPNKPYPITIIYQALNHKCHLYDLSLGGIALNSSIYYSIPVGSEVVLHIPSDVTGEMYEISAILVYKSSYEGGHKYHFKINLSLQEEGDFSRYITNREKEIIKQLREEVI